MLLMVSSGTRVVPWSEIVNLMVGDAYKRDTSAARHTAVTNLYPNEYTGCHRGAYMAAMGHYERTKLAMVEEVLCLKTLKFGCNLLVGEGEGFDYAQGPFRSSRIPIACV